MNLHTCPACEKPIGFESEDITYKSFTNGFDTFTLGYIVCPECHTILPHVILDQNSGEIHTEFTFTD